MIDTPVSERIIHVHEHLITVRVYKFDSYPGPKRTHVHTLLSRPALNLVYKGNVPTSKESLCVHSTIYCTSCAMPPFRSSPISVKSMRTRSAASSCSCSCLGSRNHSWFFAVDRLVLQNVSLLVCFSHVFVYLCIILVVSNTF